MSSASAPPDPAAPHSSSDRSDVILAQFLASSPAVQRAAASLRDGAEFAITFTDVAGVWRVYRKEAGVVGFEPVKAIDPDFELRIPPAAVHSLCSRNDTDVGDLGVAFFEHIVARRPELKIHVTVHSGLVKLTRRGWLGVLNKGGSKIMLWLARKGLRGPGGIASALGRLHG